MTETGSCAFNPLDPECCLLQMQQKWRLLHQNQLNTWWVSFSAYSLYAAPAYVCHHTVSFLRQEAENADFLFCAVKLATRRCYFQSEHTNASGAPQIVQFVMFCTITNHILLYLNVVNLSMLEAQPSRVWVFRRMQTAALCARLNFSFLSETNVHLNESNVCAAIFVSRKNESAFL